MSNIFLEHFIHTRINDDGFYHISIKVKSGSNRNRTLKTAPDVQEHEIHSYNAKQLLLLLLLLPHVRWGPLRYPRARG
ncbi:hypothetical protein X777_11173 [Ooceraea biroi]|uniref:Uncharacterized protein n=1 Tax=Ooceraea biroi TaxID=2015173 RepID=A0A026W2Q7_OOCBI|nr:hypothetical protein X777_11173 [Ooceraea biroi]